MTLKNGVGLIPSKKKLGINTDIKTDIKIIIKVYLEYYL